MFSTIDGIPNDGIPIKDMVTVHTGLTVVYVILTTAGGFFAVVLLNWQSILSLEMNHKLGYCVHSVHLLEYTLCESIVGYLRNNLLYCVVMKIILLGV